MAGYAQPGNPDGGTTGLHAQNSLVKAMGTRRRPKACDSCYQRKIRCDEGDGVCSNCIKFNQRCVVTKADGSRVTRDGNAPTQPTRQQPAVPSKRQISPSARQRQPYQYQYTSPHRQQQDPGSGAPQSIELELPPSGQSFLSRDSLAANGYEGVVLIEPVENPQKWIYVGKTSPQVLAKSAEEFSKHDGFHLRVMDFFCPLLSHGAEIGTPSRPKRPPLIGKQMALSCVDAFFRSIPHTLPFMDEPRFRKAFEDYYGPQSSDDVVDVCCTYLVIAIGARSCSDDSGICTNHFSAAWSMYGEIIALPYLSSVQCLVLMTIELMNQNKEGQAIFTIGTAIRMAQSLGMHRALSAHKEVIELNFIEKDYHLRSRVWWTCYCLDKKISFEFGRLPIINDSDCDLDSILALTPNNTQGQSLNDASLRPSVFPSLVRICQILSTIMSRLFSRTAQSNDEQSLLDSVASVDKMLLDWRNSLPPQWSADPELMGADLDQDTLHSLILHCTYYNALLVIHRAALFGKIPAAVKEQLSMRMASAETVCLNASRALAKCINVMAGTSASWPFIRWTTPFCTNIIFTLYMGVVKRPTHWMADADIGLMRSIFRCFASSCSHQVAVEPFRKLLQTLEQGIEIVRAKKQLQENAQHSSGLAQHTEPARVGADQRLLVDQENSAGVLQPEAAPVAARNQFVPLDTDLQYQDFFDFGAGTDLMNGFQLWPIDLDGADV